MGAYELLGLLRQEGLRSPLQIYRALDRLVEQGLVHRIESLSAFALCVHSECGTHGRAAFAICANCGRASEVHDLALERVLRRIARRQGFQTNSATVELSGLCEACAH
ncbi:Fur family transcriptional regulator [Mesorhizobium sp.]|nr:Fur family transcriptional regulator [Mesorhizobium sp.]